MPWFPYFRKIALSDIFVVMDNVQYQKNGLQNRNKIRNYNGDFWLTIPVTGHLDDLIKYKKIAEPTWNKKHWKSLYSSYFKAPNWSTFSEELEAIFALEYETLFEINDKLFRFVMNKLEIATQVLYLSDIGVGGVKSELVFNICNKLDATVYLGGYGGKDYLAEMDFQLRGIEIRYLESKSPVYHQFNGQFIEGLSILDLIFNVDLPSIGQMLIKP
jgi:hypothetical protein